MSEIVAYSGMFWTALLAATVLPGASEALFAALLVAGSVEPWLLLAVAATGNTLGSIVNWFLGRFMLRFRERRWFPVSPRAIDRGSRLFQRYGQWSLLFAWTPVVGDALTVAAGMLRIRLLPFIFLVGIGKLVRYGVLMGGAAAIW